MASAINQVDMAEVREDGVVVAVDENRARPDALARLAHEDGIAHPDAAPAQIAEFDGIAVEDDGLHPAEEREELPRLLDDAGRMAEVEIG
jgi:hypothetical protein